MRFRCIIDNYGLSYLWLCTQEFTDVALVHSAVLRKRNFAILGEWLPGVRFSEVANVVVSIRNTTSVRCSVGVRFSEGPLWKVPLYIALVYYLYILIFT